MATKKFSEYAIEGNNVTLTYDNVNDTVTFDVNVDKNDVGLGNVDNTSDINKPISTATQTALDSKASTTALTTHTSDLNNPHAVTKAQVGLGNVDNTSDLNKPISTATQTALNAKQDSLGFIPVTNARTLTINGTTYDISANRTWNVGDLVSTGSYANPTWLTSLAWGKLTGTPTTLSGYGILDAVPSSRTLTINGTSYDLSADRSWTISTATPTLAQVTTAGNTTTNSISVGGLTVATNLIYTDLVNSRVGIGTSSPTDKLEIIGATTTSFSVHSTGTGSNGRVAFTLARVPSVGSTTETGWQFLKDASDNFVFRLISAGTATDRMYLYTSGNVGIGTTSTDAGYKLDVNGTTRLGGDVSIKGTGTTSATNALTVQNGSGTTYIAVANDGRVSLGTGGSFQVQSSGNIYAYTSIIANDFYARNTGLTFNTNGIRYTNFTGTVTASSALAQGVYFNNTLVAAANNDVLVGLDINPTFTNGAFTGVSNIGVRVQKGTLRLASISADPTTAANGDMYYNTTSNTFKVYQGGAWKTITAI